MDIKIGTHGGDLKHIYTQDGEIKESNGNLNKETTTSGVKTGGDKLVKMESGTWSTSTQSKGSDTSNAITPVVLSNGQIVPTTKSSGSTVKPVYVDGGAIKPITGSKGNDTRPVYLDNGEIKETTFPQADVVGVDAQHKVVKTTVGDGLKVESNTLKVNYGNGIKLDTSDPKKIIADVTVSPSYTTGTQVANVKVGATDGIIKVPTATSSQLGLVKNGSNINNSSGTLSVPHAGDNLSNPGVLKTTKKSTVVGTDDSGNLKAATVTTGTSDDTTIASKGYVDEHTPIAGRLVEVDSPANGGTKVHVKVDNSLKNADGTVKPADFVGIGANGQLVAKTITVPTVPTAGFLLEDVGGVRKVKNQIESELGSIVDGAIVPLGLYKNGTTVQLALDFSSPTDEPSFHIGNVTGGGYTEIVPFWGQASIGDEYVTYPTTVGGTVTKGNMTITKTTNTSGVNVYQYDIAIPRFVDGIRLLTVDFCCAGDNENSADMRVWLINGSAAVNIAKVHSFSYGYKSDGEQVNSNRYSSYQGILPIKSGVDIRFVSSEKLRHAHILLFNR